MADSMILRNNKKEINENRNYNVKLETKDKFTYNV